MNLTQIDTVLFDIGNTLVLVDYDQIVTSAAQLNIAVTVDQLRKAEHAGKRVVDNEILTGEISTDNTRWINYFKAILSEAGFPAESVDGLLFEINRLDKIDFGIWSKLNPDTPDVLQELQARGYRLGVISNADGRVPALTVSLGIDGYFRTIIDSHEVGVEKPDPAIFKIALEKMNSSADRAVYVGDLYAVDVRGAQAAGIMPLLIDPYDQYDVNDCIKIRSLKDILSLLPQKAFRA
ncbi:HAD family hydrolase [candidate division KSB1 bacterium]